MLARSDIQTDFDEMSTATLDSISNGVESFIPSSNIVSVTNTSITHSHTPDDIVNESDRMFTLDDSSVKDVSTVNNEQIKEFRDLSAFPQRVTAETKSDKQNTYEDNGNQESAAEGIFPIDYSIRTGY